MNIDELKVAIGGMFDAHPLINVSDAGHVTHAKRFQAANGAHIAWRCKLTTQQNLYVQLDRVRLTELKDIDHEVSTAADRTRDEPNANIFHRQAFSRDGDIVTFTVKDVWQAARVLAEVAGLAA